MDEVRRGKITDFLANCKLTRLYKLLTHRQFTASVALDTLIKSLFGCISVFSFPLKSAVSKET